MPSTIEQIASWACQLDFAAIPEQVVERAKLQILSTLAAVYSGYPIRQVRAIREVSLNSRAAGRATVFPMGDKTSPTVAVVANAAASMALDYDDYLFMGHTGHSSVLASLALAEETGTSGQEWLRAQIAANELGGRLGASIFIGPQNGQLWTHIHAAASALAGSLILKLEPHPCANAMALALYQPPMAMWPGFMGPDSKLLSAAWPARDGLFAAQLASWGLSGPTDIIDSKQGFGSHFSYQFLPQMLTGFGQSWVTNSLSYKIYPGCAYISTALDALLEICDQFKSTHNRPLEPADVVALDVETNIFGNEMEKLANSAASPGSSPIRVNFSFALSLAIALKAGNLTPADLDEEKLQRDRDEIHMLANKVKVSHNWSMTFELLSRLALQLPLGALLGDLEIRKLLSQRSDVGLQFGLLTDVKLRDLLRMSAYVWDQAPNLMRQAGRAAASSLTKFVSDETPEPGFDLGRVSFDKLSLAFGSKVILTVRGEESFQAHCNLAKGAAGRDFSETKGLVRKKFRDLAGPFIGEQKVRAAIEMIEGLGQIQNLNLLSEVLCSGKTEGYN